MTEDRNPFESHVITPYLVVEHLSTLIQFIKRVFYAMCQEAIHNIRRIEASSIQKSIRNKAMLLLICTCMLPALQTGAFPSEDFEEARNVLKEINDLIRTDPTQGLADRLGVGEALRQGSQQVVNGVVEFEANQAQIRASLQNVLSSAPFRALVRLEQEQEDHPRP